ncbi:MAG: PD-(D/E)XK nuclease family protein, partial [Clostridia bacterium]|nr:PD-(D/E)XK nuclease family protein [Clostridia bacterium]
MPDYRPGKSRSDYYGVTGVADVIASVAIRSAPSDNLVLKYLQPLISSADDEYEVIIDYKGMRRPGLNDLRWEHHRWQILTYAWLRSRQPDSKPVKAGVIFYLNELVPSQEDLKRLQKEVAESGTDLIPTGEDFEKLRAWRPGRELPVLSKSFREKRSIRVIPIDEDAIGESLGEFDNVVREIESSVLEEKRGVSIRSCWRTEFREETCTACDFKT